MLHLRKIVEWQTRAAAQVSFDEEEGAALEDAATAAHWKTRAFADYGDGQRAMCLTADYSDEWFLSGDKSFRCYYVCMANSGWDYAANTPAKCGHLILSTGWDRALADPWAVKQRWYCTICGARYCPKFGVLIEMSWGQEAYYCLASFPPHDIRDAKWMAIQDRFEKYQTPQELYEALPLSFPPPSRRTASST